MLIKTLQNNDAEWPNALNNIYSPPERLYLAGVLPPEPRVGIIGSRRPTAYGRAITSKFAGELARQGVATVSGMAIGIDSFAHKASLDGGAPTVAVLPSSLHKPYPVRHKELAKSIAQQGALVSEYAQTKTIRKEYFIARNRIIAALSTLLIVIEATHRSGTMHTVRFALELGKEVGAVPGPIDSTNSEGTNYLIQGGAHLISSTADILPLIGIAKSAQPKHRALNPSEQIILESLHHGAATIAEIMRRTQLSRDDILTKLTDMELESIVARRSDGMYALR